MHVTHMIATGFTISYGQQNMQAAFWKRFLCEFGDVRNQVVPHRCRLFC